MMLFKFESVNAEGCKVTQEFEADIWMEALDYFVKFLQGSGYSLDSTSVGVNAAQHCMDAYAYELASLTAFSKD